MVPVKRALRLVIDGKAEIVEAETGDPIRSPRVSIPKPAIIRLVKFVHVPRKFRRQVTNTSSLPAMTTGASTVTGPRRSFAPGSA
jgi:hypothetical protein